MDTYEFPYSGSGGKGDTWEGIIDVELSDEDYARVEASIKKGHFRMCEDDEIDDIYQRIYDMIIDVTLEIERDNDMIDEYREDYDCDEDATDRDVIELFLDEQGCSISYPYDLQEKYWENADEEDGV